MLILLISMEYQDDVTMVFILIHSGLHPRGFVEMMGFIMIGVIYSCIPMTSHS